MDDLELHALTLRLINGEITAEEYSAQVTPMPDWYTAPIPRRWHRCKPASSGVAGSLFVERCACGAARLDGNGPWINRNTRTRRRDGR